MPHWGRPSGASKRRQHEWSWEWEQEQRRRWAEQRHFEELESDEDDGVDVGWEMGRQPPPFVSDELYFTGVELKPRSKKKRQSVYTESESSDNGTEPNQGDQGDMQVALRDRERELVHTAMERMRRAQMLGQPSVRLTTAEIEALQRDGQRASSSKSKKHRGSGSDHGRSRTERRHRSDETTVSRRRASSSASSHKRKSKALAPVYDPESPPYIPGLAPEGYVDVGLGQLSPYPQLNHPPPRRKRSSNPVSQPTSSSRTQSRTPPSLPYPGQNQQSRYFSLPEVGPSPGRSPPSSSRGSRKPSPLAPPNPDLVPRNRSRPATQAVYAVDPVHYQAYPLPLPQPLPPRLAEGRRGVSGPAQVQYALPRRQPPTSAYSPEGSRMTAASSDPYLVRRWPPADHGESGSDGSSGQDTNEESSEVEVEVEVRRSIGDLREAQEPNVPTRYPRRRRGA